MTTLLGEYAHQLLEWAPWFSHFKLDLYAVTIHQITCKWRIVIRVVPVPTLASLVVVCENPLQSFDVGLFDFLYEFSYIVWIRNQELVGVVAHLPPVNSELDMIDITIDLAFLFGFGNTFGFFYHKFLGKFILFFY